MIIEKVRSLQAAVTRMGRTPATWLVSSWVSSSLGKLRAESTISTSR